MDKNKNKQDQVDAKKDILKEEKPYNPDENGGLDEAFVIKTTDFKSFIIPILRIALVLTLLLLAIEMD